MKVTASFIIIFIFCILKVNGQTIKNYKDEWAKVDALIEKKSLPKSALAEVNKIYARAKADKQQAQVIKAVTYMISLQQQFKEDNEENAIALVQKEIAMSKEPVTSILKSYLATLYWQYFQRNRWQLYNRTQTVMANKKDIATWSAGDFHATISQLYLQSIQHKNILQQQKLEPYDAIIEKGNVRYLRPSLYDLLAHEALGYFKNDERDINRPAYAFEIDQAEVFAPAEIFIHLKITTNDTLSLQHKALLIYQELLKTHLNDDKKDALIDADISRIEFVYSNSVHEDKDSLYEAALQTIIQKWGMQPTAQQAHFLLAGFWESKAVTYHPLQDTSYRYHRLRAKEILEKVVKEGAKKSEGYSNSYNLLQEITTPRFSFQVENVNVPHLPFRALVKYKNVAELHFRLIQLGEKIKNSLNEKSETYWKNLVNEPAIRTWQQLLPATNDLQEHAVEIKVESLPIGEYILLASAGADFQIDKAILGAHAFYVSNISFIHKEENIFVLDRQTGQPLKKATVKVFENKYDYKASRYIKNEINTYLTNNNGYTQMDINDKKKKNRNSSIINIYYEKDSLLMDDVIYNYHSYDFRGEEQEDLKKIFYFTDRAIYRPGQTVYFKGITLNNNATINKIAENYETIIFLLDANSQKIDSLQVTTNEYGSFSGKFTLSQQVMNGLFSIRENEISSSVSFSVEEYKRPKFYTSFLPVKESYAVGDSITVRGNAIAYAGNVINNAAVTYRVVRQPRLIYPWLFKGWWPQVAPMEIAHGTTVTDKTGNYTIQFKAIPDKTVLKKYEPLFDYLISADVTDIDGETRSATYTVSAGYKSILLTVKMEERISIDSIPVLYITTENMAGESQPVPINISITKLLPENRLIRNRYWQQPDVFTMSKEGYIAHFPHDEYKNESDFKTWTKGEKVFEKVHTSRQLEPIQIPQFATPGFYEVVITTKDKEGQEIKAIQYVEIYNEKKNDLHHPQYFWAKGVTNPIEPGNRAAITIGTSANNVFLIQELERPDSIDSSINILYNRLNSEKQTFILPITDKDRGGFGVTFLFIKDNRFYIYTEVINVPWSNKELKIEYSTFRDKTLPGSNEQWQVKISGFKGNKIAAEMLASMYDASLDQFTPHNWAKPDIWPIYASKLNWIGGQNFEAKESEQRWYNGNDYLENNKQYDDFKFIPYYGGNRLFSNKYNRMTDGKNIMADVQLQEVAVTTERVKGIKTKERADTTGYQSAGEIDQIPAIENIAVRKNFNETAFFFPHLQTDTDGNIEFSFTTPEALTTWKLQTLAHTKNLALGLNQQQVITQKELMVQPNIPRFLREGDRLELSTKIVNLSPKEFTGQAQLQLIDAATDESVDGWFQNIFPVQYFTVDSGKSEVIKFPVEVPFLFNKALKWRIVAKAGTLSDGEEAFIPVLTNRMLVTETMPLPMRGEGTKNFTFNKLLQSGNSQTLQQHALTVEYTANPAWYAVQALPYLKEYPFDCAEQIWNGYYANALATHIINASPRIKQMFEQWKEKDTAALLSNLQKNEELKAVLLQETPWVMAVKTEEEQKKNLALLFDLARMSREQQRDLKKLASLQSSNGGFVWFKGGPDDRFITQYITTGIGHLKKLNSIPANSSDDINEMAKAAIAYLDAKLKEDYNNLIKHKADLKSTQISYTQYQYLYMRSFFREYPIPAATQTAYNFYKKQAQQYWMKANQYMQGMAALALYRNGDVKTPANILASLKETAIVHDELGMYWKEVQYGYRPFWWYAPVETQSLLIEAFSEISKDTTTVNNIKTWLIKNKQTNHWRTTKATADACYAFLLEGTNWLVYEPSVAVTVGNKTVSNTTQNKEAGAGYFKQIIAGPFVNPEMGNIKVTVGQLVNNAPGKTNGLPSWGAVYWQYFEDLDKITTAATPLQVQKKLFIQTNTDRGPLLTPVNENAVQVGDKIIVRIELKTDRDLEYVHMKDMRASAFEPVNVLSGYKWQGGLGYYETTKDAGTHFFFNNLRKGTYVFEYPLFINHAGNFSNGITTVQCMYAPEFSAHSEGVRVRIE